MSQILQELPQGVTQFAEMSETYEQNVLHLFVNDKLEKNCLPQRIITDHPRTEASVIVLVSSSSLNVPASLCLSMPASRCTKFLKVVELKV